MEIFLFISQVLKFFDISSFFGLCFWTFVLLSLFLIFWFGVVIRRYD